LSDGFKRKKAEVFRKKADTSAMIGKTGDTAPMCGGGQSPATVRLLARRRDNADSYGGAGGIALRCLLIEQKSPQNNFILGVYKGDILWYNTKQGTEDSAPVHSNSAMGARFCFLPLGNTSPPCKSELVLPFLLKPLQGGSSF